MDMLHLVPAMLVCSLGVWLTWPVVVDPIERRRRLSRLRAHGSTDALADAIFREWSDQADGTEPTAD